MALEELLGVVEIPKQAIVNMLSGLSIPQKFLNPLFQIPYAKEISFGIIMLFALISIFVGIKWMIKLAGISFTIVGFLDGLSGGIISVVMILGIAALIKIIKKIALHGGSGGGLGKGFGKKEKMDFGGDKISGGDEFKMPGESETSGGDEFSMPEEKTPSEPLQPQQSQQAMQPQQKVCPYCGTPLQYVPQYQRYYCPRCQRYI